MHGAAQVAFYSVKSTKGPLRFAFIAGMSKRIFKMLHTWDKSVFGILEETESTPLCPPMLA